MKRAAMKTMLLRFTRSIWAFPVTLFVIVMVLCALKVHGSSVGIYHQIFYGNREDPALVFGKPQAVRSDEWLSNTPFTVSQDHNNYQTINPDIGGGHDISVIKDIPEKSWVSIFKPQNWGFFFLPLENAFSLRWLMLGYLLLVSVYFFVLELLPGRRLLAVLLAVGLYANPFFHWWYLATTFGVVFYCLFALTLLMRIHRSNSRTHKLLYAAGLSFVGTAFLAILYPPFQISATVVAGAFYLGFLLNTYLPAKPKLRRKIGRDLALIAASFCLVFAFASAYYIQHKQVIEAVMSSEHPGKRRIKSADFNSFGAPHQFMHRKYAAHQMAPHLNYRLQIPEAGAAYIDNRSEASNFILFAPFLMLASVWVIFRDWRKRSKADWLLITTTSILVLLFVRQYIPGTDILFKPLLLDRVPNYRLLLGMGFGQFLLLVAYMRHFYLKPIKDTLTYRVWWCIGGLAFATYLLSGLYLRKLYPVFINNPLEILIMSGLMALIVYLLISTRWRGGLLLLAVFGLFSVGLVNPVYRGLGPLTNTELSKEIRRISDKKDNWVILRDIRMENYAISSGRPSLTGLYSYPRTELWRLLDPDGSQSAVYNRSAHVVFTYSSDPKTAEIYPVEWNKFGVLISPCSSATKKMDIKFWLSEDPINDRCLKLRSKVVYPAATFYLYKTTD